MSFYFFSIDLFCLWGRQVDAQSVYITLCQSHLCMWGFWLGWTICLFIVLCFVACFYIWHVFELLLFLYLFLKAHFIFAVFLLSPLNISFLQATLFFNIDTSKIKILFHNKISSTLNISVPTHTNIFLLGCPLPFFGFNNYASYQKIVNQQVEKLLNFGILALSIQIAEVSLFGMCDPEREPWGVSIFRVTVFQAYIAILQAYIAYMCNISN